VLSNGAALTFDAPLALDAGSLTGNGTVNGNVTSSGLISPGFPFTGQLDINGNLNLLATSSLLFELGGALQGINYDYLAVGGNGVLGGTLLLSFQNGHQFSLLPTDTFTVLTAAGVSGLTGAFANIANGQRMLTADGFGTFQINYGVGSAFAPNSLVLSDYIVVIPEPSTYALLGLGLLIVFVSVRRKRC
jgi:hypothetical protein